MTYGSGPIKKKMPKMGMKETLKPTKKGQKPIAFKEGGLHTSTGTPMGQPISDTDFAAALSGTKGPKAEKRAQFKKNVLTGPKKGK